MVESFATDLRFEYAARLRDEVKELKRELREESGCSAGRWVELPGFYPIPQHIEMSFTASPPKRRLRSKERSLRRRRRCLRPRMRPV